MAGIAGIADKHLAYAALLSSVSMAAIFASVLLWGSAAGPIGNEMPAARRWRSGRLPAPWPRMCTTCRPPLRV